MSLPPSTPQDAPLPEPVRPKRRPRYAGKNPRRFEDKYKERDPAKYPETIAKVMASGKTPAGTHRPIMVEEILTALQPKPGDMAVDCTLGYGGHAEALLPRLLPGGRLIGIDTDAIELPRTEARLRALGHGAEALAVAHSNFAGIQRVMAAHSLAGADLILADLGVSSMQLDNPGRGFSFKVDGPLDLRLNPHKGAPASQLLARLDAESLARIFHENGDEPRAGELAEAIIRQRVVRPIESTLALRRLVERVVPDPSQSMGRVFQALRIAVNDEFGVLDHLLRSLPNCLTAGGRVAILTFHSGEDRRVKKAFQEGKRVGIYGDISEEPIRPSPKEVHANPRASSAKLRWAQRA